MNATREPFALVPRVTVKQAAIRYPSGETHGFASGDHSALLKAIGLSTVRSHPGLVLGFRLSDGRFVDRAEAMRVALAAGQVDPDDVGDRLYCEDLRTNHAKEIQ